jgi:predicted Zn finger-like uncharacterized protein
MSVRVVCPACRAAYPVGDGYRGKRVRCAKCQEPFWVDGALADPDEEVVTATLVQARTPRGPRRDDDDFRDEVDTENRFVRRPAGHRHRVLLIVGAASLVVLLALLAGLAVALRGGAGPGLPDAFGGHDAVADAATPTALPAAVLRDVKGATVFVKVEAGAASGSGSGFVLKTEGATGYVVTNHHVVTQPPDEDPASGWGPFRGRRPPMFRPPFLGAPVQPVVTLVFHSGTPQERSAQAEVVLSDAARDLALLRVVGLQQLPTPIPLVRKPPLAETMPVFLFGFPFGEALTLDDGNPAVTVGKGSVSSIRLNGRGEIARIQIDGDLNPGNSGGPVVDGQGRLVGIAVAKVRNTQIGLAIPPGELITMLEQGARH